MRRCAGQGMASVGQRTQRFAYSEARRDIITSSGFIAYESEPRSESSGARHPVLLRTCAYLTCNTLFTLRVPLLSAGRAGQGVASVGQRTQRFAYSEARRDAITSSNLIADESEPRSESSGARRPVLLRACAYLACNTLFTLRVPLLSTGRAGQGVASVGQRTQRFAYSEARRDAITSSNLIADESEPRSESSGARRPSPAANLRAYRTPHSISGRACAHANHLRPATMATGPFG